jgi:hypothetical protein
MSGAAQVGAFFSNGDAINFSGKNHEGLLRSVVCVRVVETDSFQVAPYAVEVALKSCANALRSVARRSRVERLEWFEWLEWF